MEFDIILTSTARRDLQRLPEKAVHAVIELLYGSLAENPHRLGKPLRFELLGRWSARRGDYRIIYRIDDEGREVIVEVITHRSDAYRSR